MQNGVNPETGEVIAPVTLECGPAMEALVAKVVAACKDMEHIEKTGFNNFHKYKYLTVEDTVTVVRRALLNHGIFMYRSSCMMRSHEMRAGEPDERGKIPIGTYVTLDLEFTLTDGSARIVLPATAEARDTSDKATQKAETSALKYALFQNFLLQGNEDDLDTGEGNPDNYPQQQTRTVSRPAATPPRPVPPSTASGTPPPKPPQTPAQAPRAAQAAPTTPPPAPTQRGAASGGSTGLVTAAQVAKLRDYMTSKKQSETAVLRYLKVEKLENATDMQYKALCSMWRFEP